MAPAPIKVQGSLAGRNMGNIRAVADPNAPASILLGTLYGVAKGLATGKNQDGEVFTGVSGIFQFDKLSAFNPDKPAEAREIVEHIQSGRLFLPTGIGGELITAMEAAIKAKEELPEIRFAFKVHGIKASNAAGYSWQFEPLMQAAKTSPIEALKRELHGALDAPEKAPELEHKPQGEAPAPDVEGDPVHAEGVKHEPKSGRRH